MADRYGKRGVIALHVPMQNANMQPEFEMLRPDGISNQVYRIEIGAPDETTSAIINGSLGCGPDIVVFGVSMEMHNWSEERQARHRSTLQAALGDTPLVLASDATVIALRAVGASRISILSPMTETHAASARRFYETKGFEVIEDYCLGVQRSEDIIKVSDDAIVKGFNVIDRPNVDVLLHIGGALSVLALVEQLEERHGKPVVSVNAASYWMALRWLGIQDQINGFGKFLKLPLPDGARLSA